MGVDIIKHCNCNELCAFIDLLCNIIMHRIETVKLFCKCVGQIPRPGGGCGSSWKCGTQAFVKDSFGNLIKWGIQEEGNTVNRKCFEGY